jgi:hypothetical protein
MAVTARASATATRVLGRRRRSFSRVGDKTASRCRSQEMAPVGARLCEHTFVTAFRYTVAEHDPSRPWVVVAEIRHLTVELDRAEDFADWAAERWPQSRYTAQLDPGQEERRLKY